MKFKKKAQKTIKSHTWWISYIFKRCGYFPSNAPAILDRGKGVYIFDKNGKKYLDYGMGLRSVNVGYAENSINNAAISGIKKGNNLTRPL